MQKKFLINLINKLTSLNPYSRRIILLIVDLIIIYFSFFLTKILSHGDKSFLYDWMLLPNLLISLSVYLFTGHYRGLTRYISINSIYLIAKRNLIIIIFLILFGFLTGDIIPDFALVFTLYINQTLLIGFEKYILGDILLRYSNDFFKKVNVVIYGTGESAVQLAYSLRLNYNYKILFFVDNQSNMTNRYIYGIPIKGSYALSKYKDVIDEVFLAESSLKRKTIREIVKKSQSLGFSIKQIPSISEVTTKDITITNLRQIKIEEILGRDITLQNKIKETQKGIFENILITGAGGSIGSELSKQIVNLRPKQIIIVDNSEPSLYEIHQNLLAYNLEGIIIIPILGDSTSINLIEKVIQEYTINLILHAAAYKHVPLVEDNPIQGIYNNVFSTKILCDASIKFDVDQFMLISTDKAVRPSNVMGMSKRLAELIVQAFAGKHKNIKNTKFSIVRFGNVLGSSGSVVPLFKKQIIEGGPITLTHENIVRYFMTISEAVQLVIQAVFLTKGGEIFLLDMGEPMKIKDLAIQMINLSGLSVKDEENINGDIEIKCIGLRQGEKLFEELLIDGTSKKTANPLIFEGVEKSIPFDELLSKLNKLEKELFNLNQKESFTILADLVPEWNISDIYIKG